MLKKYKNNFPQTSEDFVALEKFIKEIEWPFESYRNKSYTCCIKFIIKVKAMKANTVASTYELIRNSVV